MDNDEKTICLRYECSLLEEHNDSITELAIIDYNGNVLFNEHFSENNLLSDKVDEINRIIKNAEHIIDYDTNIKFPLLQKNGIRFKEIEKKNFVNDFAVMYGKWNSLNQSFVRQPLPVCAKWFGFDFNLDNSALKNAMIILSCYKKVQNDIVKNNGYIIFDTFKNAPGQNTVIAYNKNAPEPFVVWLQIGKNHFYGGNYFSKYDNAMSYFVADFTDRCYKIGKTSDGQYVHIINKYNFDKEIAQISKSGKIDFFENNLPTKVIDKIEEIAEKIKVNNYSKTVIHPLRKISDEIKSKISNAYANNRFSEAMNELILKYGLKHTAMIVSNHIRLCSFDVRYNDNIKQWAENQEKIPEIDNEDTYNDVFEEFINSLNLGMHPVIISLMAEKLIEFSKAENDIKNFADSLSEFKKVSEKEIDILKKSNIPFKTSKQQDGFIIKYNKVYSSQVNQILTQINSKKL